MCWESIHDHGKVEYAGTPWSLVTIFSSLYFLFSSFHSPCLLPCQFSSLSDSDLTKVGMAQVSLGMMRLHTRRNQSWLLILA
jgi:hypothetical protein